MSVYHIISIVVVSLFFLLSGFVFGLVCLIIFSGLKGSGHNVGPTYFGGFGAHHPGGIILSDEERKALKDKYMKREVIISY